jgi:hypothetical protein
VSRSSSTGVRCFGELRDHRRLTAKSLRHHAPGSARIRACAPTVSGRRRRANVPAGACTRRTVITGKSNPTLVETHLRFGAVRFERRTMTRAWAAEAAPMRAALSDPSGLVVGCGGRLVRRRPSCCQRHPSERIAVISKRMLGMGRERRCISRSGLGCSHW